MLQIHQERFKFFNHAVFHLFYKYFHVFYKSYRNIKILKDEIKQTSVTQGSVIQSLIQTFESFTDTKIYQNCIQNTAHQEIITKLS